MLERRRPSLLWPLLFVGLGALLLARNFGLLPPGVWAALLQLWPVLLIVIGLDMLLGRRSRGGIGAVLAVSSLVLVGALTWSAVRASQLGPQPAYQTALPSRGAEAVSVTIDFDAGTLSVAPLGPSDYVLEGEIQNGPGEALRHAYTVRNGQGQLRLEQTSEPLLLPFLRDPGSSARWDLRLTPRLPLSLDIRTGASQTDLDLTGLAVTRLDLRAGLGQTRVAFPAAGKLTAQVRTGLGAADLTVPEGLPTRITVRSGVASVHIPSRFAQAGSVYTTPGFNTDGDYIDLTVSAGIGNVTVK